MYAKRTLIHSTHVQHTLLTNLLTTMGGRFQLIKWLIWVFSKLNGGNYFSTRFYILGHKDAIFEISSKRRVKNFKQKHFCYLKLQYLRKIRQIGIKILENLKTYHPEAKLFLGLFSYLPWHFSLYHSGSDLLDYLWQI